MLTVFVELLSHPPDSFSRDRATEMASAVVKGTKVISDNPAGPTAFFTAVIAPLGNTAVRVTA